MINFICFIVGVIIGFSVVILYFKYKTLEPISVFDKDNRFTKLLKNNKKIKPRINDDKAAWMIENGRET